MSSICILLSCYYYSDNDDYLIGGSYYEHIYNKKVKTILRIKIRSTLGPLTFYINPNVYDYRRTALDNTVVRAGLISFSDSVFIKYHSLNYSLISVEHISCEEAFLEIDTLNIYRVTNIAVYCHNNDSLSL